MSLFFGATFTIGRRFSTRGKGVPTLAHEKRSWQTGSTIDSAAGTGKVVTSLQGAKASEVLKYGVSRPAALGIIDMALDGCLGAGCLDSTEACKEAQCSLPNEVLQLYSEYQGSCLLSMKGGTTWRVQHATVKTINSKLLYQKSE